MSKLRVLKLGGSLLARRDWPASLRSWLQHQPAATNFLIIGGGDIVEAVRELDGVHQFDAAFTHWLCIDLLSATLHVAKCLLPEVPVITQANELQLALNAARTQATSTLYLVQVAAFYSQQATTPLLPENWNTTSDSLAAWLALLVAADELVLFKSVAAPAGITSVIELSQLGIVDGALLNFADRLKAMQLVDLSS